jgi:class 3 adenylate cyclase
MSDRAESGAPFPEHPELREIAEAMEFCGISGEILDENFEAVFISSQLMRILGLRPEDLPEIYGISLVMRALDHDPIYGISPEAQRAWWRTNVPIMRRYVSPGSPEFDSVFGSLTENAARVEPLAHPPRAWGSPYEPSEGTAVRNAVAGEMRFFEWRINDDEGRFLGVARFVRTALPEGLLTALGRGDQGLYRRMENVSDPARRPAAILFADLEGSSVLARRLSSRAYFDLISGLTDLIDTTVIGRNGIVGKHAGDGGSALFLTGDFGGSESATARAAIEAARAISVAAPALGGDGVTPRVNIGLHWGATLMVGQVATSGRLDVTALGDQMNECARIEAVATEGATLASKDLIERLEGDDAAAVAIDPETIAYTPLGELEDASEKAIRDAGAIPVAVL